MSTATRSIDPSRAPVRVKGQLSIPLDRFPGISPSAMGFHSDGHGMIPRVNDGDLVIVDPERRPEEGDVVVVWPAGDGTPLVRELAAMWPDTILISTLYPDRVFTKIPREDIAALHVVVGRLSPEEAEAARRRAPR